MIVITDKNKIIISNQKKFDEFKNICKAIRGSIRVIENRIDDDKFVNACLDIIDYKLIEANKIMSAIDESYTSKSNEFKSYRLCVMKMLEDIEKLAKKLRHEIKMGEKEAENNKFKHILKDVSLDKVNSVKNNAKELGAVMRTKSSFLTQKGEKRKQVKIPAIFSVVRVNADKKIDELANDMVSRKQSVKNDMACHGKSMAFGHDDKEDAIVNGYSRY